MIISKAHSIFFGMNGTTRHFGSQLTAASVVCQPGEKGGPRWLKIKKSTAKLIQLCSLMVGATSKEQHLIFGLVLGRLAVLKTKGQNVLVNLISKTF
jgi:hypothetical protein